MRFFSLVIKHKSIQMLLAIIVQFDLELEQMDVKTSFVRGELEEKIYMKQPEGYIQEGKKNKVYLLKNPFYGFKQSLRQWYKRFDSFMIKAKLNRCEYNSVYFKQSSDPTYLLLYVDDMLIAVKIRHIFRS